MGFGNFSVMSVIFRVSTIRWGSGGRLKILDHLGRSGFDVEGWGF